MTLSRPIKSALSSEALDAPVSRGWSRIQRKRQVRNTVRKSALAVSCLVLAGAVGWALRPVLSPPKPAPVAAVKAPLDSLVKDLPRAPAARGRAQPVVRPPEPVPAPVVEPQQPQPIPEPEVDVVAALLESVKDAYEAGNMPRASALLSEIAEKHADDPRAAQALYVLGLIQLDREKDRKGAADSFTRALEMNPAPDLVAPLWQALERARAE